MKQAHGAHPRGGQGAPHTLKSHSVSQSGLLATTMTGRRTSQERGTIEDMKGRPACTQTAGPAKRHRTTSHPGPRSKEALFHDGCTEAITGTRSVISDVCILDLTFGFSCYGVSGMHA